MQHNCTFIVCRLPVTLKMVAGVHLYNTFINNRANHSFQLSDGQAVAITNSLLTVHTMLTFFSYNLNCVPDANIKKRLHINLFSRVSVTTTKYMVPILLKEQVHTFPL